MNQILNLIACQNEAVIATYPQALYTVLLSTKNWCFIELNY